MKTTEDLEKGYTKEFYTNEIKKLYKAACENTIKKVNLKC